MSDRDPLLAPLDVLIGDWTTESKHALMDEVVPGTTTFAWLEGGHFLEMRTRFDHAQLPDALSVIGPPESGDGLVMEYFDSRGVRRTYAVSLRDGVLSWWREEPGIDQRVRAMLGGDTFELVAERAETPGEWLHDMRVVHRRA